MEQKSEYEEVQEVLLNATEGLPPEKRARDEREIARELTRFRGLDPSLADDLAALFENIDRGEYSSKKEAMAEIDFSDYHG